MLQSQTSHQNRANSNRTKPKRRYS